MGSSSANVRINSALQKGQRSQDACKRETSGPPGPSARRPAVPPAGPRPRAAAAPPAPPGTHLFPFPGPTQQEGTFGASGSRKPSPPRTSTCRGLAPIPDPAPIYVYIFLSSLLDQSSLRPLAAAASVFRLPGAAVAEARPGRAFRRWSGLFNLSG